MTNTMKSKGIIYPHEYLWRASSRSLAMAETYEPEQYYLLMQSLLTAYLAFEAFINFLGESLDSDAWGNEKNFFNQPDYFGIEGKIKRLAEKLPSFVFKKGERPYQIIKKVGRFRTLLAHGKPYHFEKKIKIQGKGPIDMFEFNWDEHISFDNVKRSREAIKKFCELLRSEAHSILEASQLSYSAFEGPLGSAESG